MGMPPHLRRTRVQRALTKLVRPARRGATHPVVVRANHLPGEPVPYADAITADDFEPFDVGDAWGRPWSTTWFEIAATIPTQWAGQEVVLVVALSAIPEDTGFGTEGLVWQDGVPLQGVSRNHDEVTIAARAQGGERVDLYIEAAANPQVNVDADPAPPYLPEPGAPPTTRLAACHLAVANREVEALYYDWSVLLDLYDQLPEREPRKGRILRALEEATDRLDPHDVVATAPVARQALAPVLAQPSSASSIHLNATGHAHIDTAWLWPLRETVRKCARTFATAATLMDRYPDYVFAASAAQHYAWIRDNYPGLYDRIQDKIGAGTFEPIGSMWVEADCNIPSGESLVRQLVHGKRFFADELGVDCEHLWLPDVFGYPANLPQIMRLAGVRWFLTQKLSWNQVNRFPHHTFWWEGLDGSRILTHFPPADTYNGEMRARELRHAEGNFAQRDLASEASYLFGHGDGGGGPTAAMLERAQRMVDLEGVPRLEFSRATETFERIEAEALATDMPAWSGELYLETHRGTYTTHAEVKAGNRRLEWALREAELWSSVAGVPDATDALDVAWKTLLLHQFHDIIPGSSIQWVYQDTARDHAAALGSVEDITAGALAELSGTAETDDTTRQVLVVNSLSHARDEVVEIDGELVRVSAPSCGWKVQEVAATSDLAPVETGEGWMSNGIVHVAWDDDGLLTSVVHLPSGREALAPGERGNVLQLFDDRPNAFDAWDIDAAALHTVRELTTADEVTLIDKDPLRAVLQVVRRFGDGRSEVRQHIRLDAGSPRLEFHTEVDWHEDHTLLKVAFPLAVRSAEASYEIQFGHVRRPTHANTSWDAARFEVCGHSWADLSEHGFGVALLNESKYGYDTHGNVMRLSLLRSPTSPDPAADRGRHRFVYALMPHAGGLADGDVIAQAHALNSPLRVLPIRSRPGGVRESAHSQGQNEMSLVEVDQPGVVVSAVKRADDGNGVILRMFEAFGGSRTVRIKIADRLLGYPVTRAERVDLLERPLDDSVVDLDTVPLGAFEIVTLRLR